MKKTISDFNNDFNKIMKGSFKKYSEQKKRLDEGFESDKSSVSDDSLKPKYISDYEKSKKD